MASTNLPARFFDENFAVRSRDLERVLDQALGKKADYADLYFEYRRNEGVGLEEGLVKNCSQSTSNGVGVRVLAEAKTGYAYTDDITIDNLAIAARTARYIAQNRSAEAAVPVGGGGGQTAAAMAGPLRSTSTVCECSVQGQNGPMRQGHTRTFSL